MIRSVSLGILVLCELIIAFTNNLEVNPASLSILISMLVVVIAAYSISALLRNFKGIAPTRNYAISGISGIVVGILFYAWIGSHLEGVLNWFGKYGILILLILIFISALILYFQPRNAQTE